MAPVFCTRARHLGLTQATRPSMLVPGSLGKKGPALTTGANSRFLPFQSLEHRRILVLQKHRNIGAHAPSKKQSSLPPSPADHVFGFMARLISDYPFQGPSSLQGKKNDVPGEPAAGSMDMRCLRRNGRLNSNATEHMRPSLDPFSWVAHGS